jgi:ATP-dependent protease HslVU (ClpYQ) peptidase subunit
MAADRRVTGDGLIHCNTRKIARATNGDIIGVAGSAFDLGAFLAWYNSDRSEPLQMWEKSEALVLTTDGKVFCYNDTGRFFEHETPAALGSGGAVAYGAMLAGASPVDAVHIASQRDIYSGGGVDFLVRP